MKKVLSAREVWETREIYWVTSYKTLLRYIARDYRHVLKPITRGKGAARRYYIPGTNVAELVRKFESSEL